MFGQELGFLAIRVLDEIMLFIYVFRRRVMRYSYLSLSLDILVYVQVQRLPVLYLFQTHLHI